MAKTRCRLLIYENHALVANLNVANMSFNTIRENKIFAKNSEFTVVARKLVLRICDQVKVQLQRLSSILEFCIVQVKL